LALLLAVLGFTPVASATETHPPSYIYGRWVVKRVLPIVGLSVGPREINAMIGTVAIYSASEARVRFPSPREEYRFENFVVEHPDYRIHRESAGEFMQESHIDLRAIGIRGDSVEVIDIHDVDGSEASAPATFLVIRDRNHVVTLWDLSWFEMVRQK
jgi:hypothetical protein